MKKSYKEFEEDRIPPQFKEILYSTEESPTEIYPVQEQDYEGITIMNIENCNINILVLGKTNNEI